MLSSMSKQEKEYFGMGFERGQSFAGNCSIVGYDFGSESWDIDTCEGVEPWEQAIESLYEAEGNDRQFSPFEHIAHDINEKENADELWEAFDEGISEGILKTLEDMARDQPDPFDQTIGEILDDVPEWIDDDVSIYQLQDIVRGGCESGAYMPAVTYHKALDTMGKYGDEVLQYVEDMYGEIPQPDEVGSWASLACYYLSLAVELYASATLNELGIEY